MTRILWIIGLSLSLVVFGGVTAMCLVGLITRHHLNFTGTVILLSNGFVSWRILEYLLLKIREQRKLPEPSSDIPGRF